jgi:tripartite ATP-independent transporter DctP family solute receptor
MTIQGELPMHRSLSRRAFGASLAATAASIAVVRSRGDAAAPEFDWKYGHDLASDHPLNVRAVEAFAKIKQRSNGRLSIRAFPDSILGGDPAMISQLRSGALEVMATPGAFLNSIVPVAAIENVAFAFANRDVAYKAMNGKVGDIVKTAIRGVNIAVMDKIWENGFRDITTSTKPIHNIADLQGLKIRVSPGKIRIDTFQSLGASPTAISAGELYTALQTKVVDGQENPLLNIETLKLYEVQKYCSLSHHMWTGYWILVNQDKWNSLPKDLQAIFADEMNAASAREWRDNQLISASLNDKLQRQGLAFNPVDVSGFKAKLVSSGYYTRWKGEFGDAAWSTLESYTGKLG